MQELTPRRESNNDYQHEGAEVAARGAPGEPIGFVDTTTGAVTILRAHGVSETASPGTAVFQGDVIATGAASSLSVTFIDSSTFAMGGDGRMVIDELMFDPDGDDGSALFTMIEGVFSFVGGEIAKFGPEAMVVRSSTVTIGVRGTEVAVRADGESGQTIVTLLAEDDGGVGEVIVLTAVGSQVLNIANQTTSVAAAHLEPSVPIILRADEIEELYGVGLYALSRQDLSALDAPIDRITPSTPSIDSGVARADADATDGEVAAVSSEGSGEASAELVATVVGANASKEPTESVASTDPMAGAEETGLSAPSDGAPEPIVLERRSVHEVADEADPQRAYGAEPLSGRWQSAEATRIEPADTSEQEFDGVESAEPIALVSKAELVGFAADHAWSAEAPIKWLAAKSDLDPTEIAWRLWNEAVDPGYASVDDGTDETSAVTMDVAIG